MEVLNGYKETSIGVLPSDWEVKKLGNLIQIKSGESPSNFQLSSEKLKYPYLKVEDLNNCDKYQKESRYYSNDEFSIVQENSVIFPKRGAAIINNKVRINSVPVQMDSNLMALTVKVKDLDFEFLYYKISKEGLFKIADTSTIPQINNKHIEPYKIPLPPLPEQQKIAEILSTWDKAIELCQKTIEELRSRNKGLAQQLLSGKKRVKGFEETIWKTVKMRNIGKIPKKEAITDIGNHRTLTVRLYAKGVDFNDSVKTVISTSGRPYYVRYKDEILIGRQNIHNGGIGIVNEKQSGNICSNAISSFVVNENNDLKFIFIKLSTPFVYKRIENFMGGTGQKELSENEWLKLEIKIPEKSEQKAISKILDTASSELKHYEEKLTNLKLQKKGLMQQLLTGKVRVRI